MIKPEELTIITPNFNKSPELFEKYLKSVYNRGTKIIIFDDKSKESLKYVYRSLVKKYNVNNNITFFESSEKLYVGGAIYHATKMAQTKWVMRFDSDDVMIDLPPLKRITNKFDVYTPKHFPRTLTQFLMNGRSLHLFIFRKWALQELYEIYEGHNLFYEFIPEDIFFASQIFTKKMRVRRLNYRQRDLFIYSRNTSNSYMKQLKRAIPRNYYRKIFTLKMLKFYNVIDERDYEITLNFLKGKYGK
jgi:cellulose synthase/poly-beta-1,6-N-acetylglucosamine synthase-like glycosyltransferase